MRLFIRGLAWDSQDSGAAFADTLKQAARARLTDTAKGKALIGTGSGGASVTYTLPPLGDLTADDVAQVTSELLDRVDVLNAVSPGQTDDQLVAGLLAAFPAPRSSVSPGARMIRQNFAMGLRRGW